MTTNKSSFTKKEVRVILAHSVTMIREGVAGLLQEAGFEIVADTHNQEDLIKLATQHNPDILLLDWALPKVPLDVVRQLSSEKAFNGVVVLVGQPEPPYGVVDAIQVGVRGFLSLNLPGEEFVSRLRLLAQGDFVVSQDLTTGMGQQLEARTLPEDPHGLSGREREILILVSTGATNKEIAEKLIVTENTVKVHLRHILDKLDLRNRQQLAVYAVREGIVKEDDTFEMGRVPYV